MELCRELEERGDELLREAGMVLTPLLIHFAGMLNPEVDPYMTPMSFNKQRIF
ncbi:YhaI family protein [Pseudalkalibacillus salsuginis]|uniref:YhaI family protein n=1 Tax=Pseudalkalibacillus salsuginis TaxID=2910972 RepID=UPI001F3A35DD|nr:YhaI family protein [Pseudalkalibacillus salsuginis]MCF6411038.1 YhaI family protein [Pseudalkalibacillus salsuginis]